MYRCIIIVQPFNSIISVQIIEKSIYKQLICNHFIYGMALEPPVEDKYLPHAQELPAHRIPEF
jgi:hypothetical protein